MGRGLYVGKAVAELAPEGDQDDLSVARLAAANIHPDTRLATDYLNHFNEVVMLIDLLPSMPDFAPEVVAWRPCSYTEHFHRSSFKGKALAIRAYATVEAERRGALEDTLEGVDHCLAEIQRLILDAPADLPLEAIADITEMRIKPLLSHAMGLINGAAIVAVEEDASGQAQSAVDALFEQ